MFSYTGTWKWWRLLDMDYRQHQHIMMVKNRWYSDSWALSYGFINSASY